MDIPALATALAASLTPALPFLVKGLEKTAQTVGGKLGERVWEQAKVIWAKLGPKVEDSPAAQQAVEDLVALPDDPDAQAALRLQLKKLLAADEGLASELAQLLEAAGQQTRFHAEVHGRGAIAQGKSAVAAGAGGTAIGGNVHGAVSTSGKPPSEK